MGCIWLYTLICSHHLIYWIISHLFCWLPFENIPLHGDHAELKTPPPPPFPPRPRPWRLLQPFPARPLHTSSASSTRFRFHLLAHSSRRWDPCRPGRRLLQEQNVLGRFLSNTFRVRHCWMVTFMWPVRVEAQTGRLEQASPHLINTLAPPCPHPSPLFCLSFCSFTPDNGCAGCLLYDS